MWLCGVVFNTGTIEITGAVHGIEVAAEEHLFKLSDYVIEGNIFDLNNLVKLLLYDNIY